MGRLPVGAAETAGPVPTTPGRPRSQRTYRVAHHHTANGPSTIAGDRCERSECASHGVHTNLPLPDIDAARTFYTDYLGLAQEEFNLGWVARYTSPDGRTVAALVTRDATSPQDSVMSVHVGSDVDDAYEEARRRGYQIVHPLTDEPWGVRRFFVRTDGNVINMVNHRDEETAAGGGDTPE